QSGGAERGRLVDGPTVVVERRGTVRLGGGGEEPAPAQGADTQPGIVHAAAQRVQPHLLDVLTPKADGFDAAGGRRLEELLHRRGAEGPAVQGQPGHRAGSLGVDGGRAGLRGHAASPVRAVRDAAASSLAAVAPPESAALAVAESISEPASRSMPFTRSAAGAGS